MEIKVFIHQEELKLFGLPVLTVTTIEDLNEKLEQMRIEGLNKNNPGIESVPAQK